MKTKLNSYRDLQLNRKYTPLSLAYFRTQYESNEWINDHAKNVLLCAYFAGSNVDLYIARRLYVDQQKAGYLTPDLRLATDRMMAKLSPALVARGASFAASLFIDDEDRKRLIDHRINVETHIKTAGFSVYQFDQCLAVLSSTAAPAYCKRLYYWALYRAFFNDFLSRARFCEYVQGLAGPGETIPTRAALFYALAEGRDFENKIKG